MYEQLFVFTLKKRRERIHLLSVTVIKFFFRLSALIQQWTSELSLRRPTTGSIETMHCATRSPDSLVPTFIGHFRRQTGIANWPRVYFDNDEGVGDGVTREAFSLFWDAVIGRMFQTQGGDLSFPTVSPTHNAELWEVIGRILAYTVAVLGHFPVACICQVVCRSLFNLQPDEDVEALVNDFLSTLGDRERGLLSPLFSSGGEDLAEFVASRRQQLLEIFREFHVPSLPQTSELRRLLVNVARYSLIELPRAAIASMRSGFQSITGSAFTGVTGEMVSQWYQEQRRPIFDEISARLQLTSDEEGAGRVFNMLTGWLREHRNDEVLLRRFLRYTTGSSNARGDTISVDIRRSYDCITHETCFSTIRLPMIEEDRDAEQAFLNQLQEELTGSVEWSFNSD